MAEPISDITIVGGGSSGWLSAAFLSAMFESALRSGRLRISLIESARIPIIGVGEALAPSMPGMLQSIGVSETDVFKRCQATFKMGGFFLNWNLDKRGRPTRWCNPFEAYDHVGINNAGYYFHRFGAKSPTDIGSLPFDRATSSTADLIAQRKGPRLVGAEDFQARFRYAYHLDATVFAQILKEAALSRGVTHIVDDVEDVTLDDRGFVHSLSLAENGEHRVQLVIDATGFRGVVIRQAMGEPFQPYGGYLLNDRAAVVQIPHDNDASIEPATRATAMNAGWSFRVPLFNRVGVGYVFASSFLSDDEAIDELKAFLGPQGSDIEPRVISWQVGKVARSWVNNCIAIGLSSGFVEPLEATAIFTVEQSLKWLGLYLPDADFDPMIADQYNRLVNELYDEIVDYVALHFLLSNRDDTAYWRTVRTELAVPDRLSGYLELWRRSMPEATDLETSHFFAARNYLTALMGKNFYDDVELARGDLLSEQVWRNYVNEFKAGTKPAVAAMPDHRALVASIRGDAA